MDHLEESFQCVHKLEVLQWDDDFKSLNPSRAQKFVAVIPSKAPCPPTHGDINGAWPLGSLRPGLMETIISGVNDPKEDVQLSRRGLFQYQ